MIHFSRTSSLTVLLLSTALASGFGGAAIAQTPTIEEKMQALEAQMEALRAELAALRAAQQQTAQAAPQQQAAAQQQPALKVAAKGAPRFSGEGFDFKVRGRIMADFGHASGASRLNDPGLGTTTEMRRARIGVEGSIDSFKYKLEADYFDNGIDVADAYIEWDKGQTAVIVGFQKTPFSLQEMTSSLYTAFLERASFTDAYDLGRELGVTVTWGGSHYGLSGGVFSNGSFSGDDEANGYVVSARGHYVADFADGWALIGASAMRRASGASPTRYRNRPLLHTTDTRLINAVHNASRDTLWGVESAVSWGPLWASAEWAWARADLAAPLGAGLDDSHASSGGYVEGGWFLTGEERGFKKGSGIWDRTKPRQGLSDGGMGAFAINLGWDYNDLSDQGAAIIGGRQTGYLASMTWIPEAHVRFIAQYAHIEIDDSFPDADGGGHVDTFGLRAQVDW